MGEQTPMVRYEPCGEWVAGADPSTAACLECGWFEEDHWMAERILAGAGGAAGVAGEAVGVRA